MQKIVLLSLFLLPFSAQAEEKTLNGVPAITVHGEATTKVAPDQVTLPVTIREENVNLKMAKEKHDKKLNGLLKLAEENGIPKENIQTSYTSVSPQYDYVANMSPRLRGYEVETTIDFKLNNISALGDFMNGIIGLGITQVGSVSYSLKDEDRVKQDTLVKAEEQAYEKASRLAATAKVGLDKPLYIEEGEVQVNRPIRPMPMMMARAGMAMSAAAPPPELPSGLMEIQQTVTVTYQLKP